MAKRRPLTSPTGKAITLAAIHPNAGLTARYQARLDAAIEAMHRSIMRFVLATYRAKTPHMAQDASPAAALRDRMAELGKRWTDRFDTLADDLGRYFATTAVKRSDAALAEALRKGGLTVRFKMTRAVNDVFRATLHEQINLIKSIPQEHLADVTSAVNRSVQAGRDVGGLAKELEHTYGVTKRRAATIARSQNNIATATITRARQAELGITEAIWTHAAAGKHPRPSHVAFSGKRYKIAEGAVLDGETVWPGTAINCRCVSRSCIPGLD